MKKKKAVLCRFIAALCASLLLWGCQPALAAGGGTDGTELQLLEAEELEIQLGQEWVGVEFQLKTDAGMYPGVIPVGKDGVLRLEIGGSKKYTLSCIGSPIPAPIPQAVLESSTLEAPSSAANPAETSSEPTIAAEAETSRPAEDNETTVAGIPVLHLCVFAGGMVLAIACLVVMAMRGRLKNQTDEDEDDEENSPD